jgi:hypothetical protein
MDDMLSTAYSTYIHTMDTNTFWSNFLEFDLIYIFLEYFLLPERYVTCIEVLHIVGAFHIIMYVPLTSTTKRLYGIELAFLQPHMTNISSYLTSNTLCGLESMNRLLILAVVLNIKKI